MRDEVKEQLIKAFNEDFNLNHYPKYFYITCLNKPINLGNVRLYTNPGPAKIALTKFLSGFFLPFILEKRGGQYDKYWDDRIDKFRTKYPLIVELVEEYKFVYKGNNQKQYIPLRDKLLEEKIFEIKQFENE